MESRVDSSSDDENGRLKKKLDRLAEDIKKLPPERIDQLEKFVHSMDKKVVSLKEVATMLDVSVDTIRRAIKSGELKAFQINKSGNWKVSIEEVERFIEGGK